MSLHNSIRSRSSQDSLLVLPNRSNHSDASLYEASPPSSPIVSTRHRSRSPVPPKKKKHSEEDIPTSPSKTPQRKAPPRTSSLKGQTPQRTSSHKRQAPLRTSSHNSKDASSQIIQTTNQKVHGKCPLASFMVSILISVLLLIPVQQNLGRVETKLSSLEYDLGAVEAKLRGSTGNGKATNITTTSQKPKTVPQTKSRISSSTASSNHPATTTTISPTTTTSSSALPQQQANNDTDGGYTCNFREYDETRLYGLEDKGYPMKNALLKKASYIFGRPPMLLPRQNGILADPQKVCRKPNQSHLKYPKNTKVPYHNVVKEIKKATKTTTHEADTLPPMDGTNPSLISTRRIREQVATKNPVWKDILNDFPDAAFVVSTCFKKIHQCVYSKSLPRWDNHYPPLPGRLRNKEMDILLLNDKLETLLTATVEFSMEKNFQFYQQNRTDIEVDMAHYDPQHTTAFPADDGRLWVHNGDIWMTYKRYEQDGAASFEEGDYQFMIKLEFVYHSANQTAAENNKKQEPASSSSSWNVYATGDDIGLCCGRNMAALNTKDTTKSSSILPVMSWPDPVWIANVDTNAASSQKKGTASRHNKTVVDMDPPPELKKGPSSHFHGTSGSLLYLPDTDEYLGIGHFHREPKEIHTSVYDSPFGGHQDALFGSRYTHAFFTVAANPPYQLQKLSPEWMFPSQNPHGHGQEADMIQFASGLEFVGHGDKQKEEQQQQLAIAYGINDCEGAITYLDWDFVAKQLLIPLEDDKRTVIGNMRKVRPKYFEKAKTQHHEMTLQQG